MPAVPTPGPQISAGAEGTYALIGIAYDGGRRHQWGAELWRNAIQSIARQGNPRGDEQVMFDFAPFEWADEDDPDTIVKTVWKRRVWNDGPPMDPTHELLAYFQTLAAGAGTNRRSRTNLAGSYGQGSRASILPHSHMMVCTTQPGGDTEALCIFDTGSNTYALVEFINDDTERAATLGKFDNEEYLLVAGHRLYLETDKLIHPTVMAHGGVTVILIGPDFLDDYIDGDPAKRESARTLADDLTKWLNSPIPVRVEYMLDPSPGTTRTHGRTAVVGGVTRRIEGRTLYGYNDWCARVPGSMQTTIVLDAHGTTMDLFLLPHDWNWSGPYTQREIDARQKKAKKTLIVHEPNPGQFFIETPDQNAWFPYDGQGFMVTAYDYEMFPLYTGNSGIVNQWKWWGVNIPAVGRRLGGIIRPPQLTSHNGGWGIIQTPSRASITGPNETPLPIEEWQNAFYNALQGDPDLEFLRKALAEAVPTHPHTLDPEVLKRIQSDVNGRLDLLNAPRVVKVETLKPTGQVGDLTDEEADVRPEHTGKRKIRRKGKRKIVIPNPTGTQDFEEKPVVSMPDYEFLTQQEWEDEFLAGNTDYMPHIFCIVDSGVGTTVKFNMGHEIYRGQLAYFLGLWWDETGRSARRRSISDNQIENAIQLQYATEGISKVFYADRLCRDSNGIFSKTEFDRLLEPEHLTLALGGWVNVDAGIKQQLINLLR